MGSGRPVGFLDRIFSTAINTTQVRQEGLDHLTIDLQVGKTVHQDVPASMRRELWMSVLHRHPGLGDRARQQYTAMLKQALPEEVADNIAKDVGRTFPNVQMFRTPEGKASLHRLLRAYAAYDKEVNYCQGMNFVAGLLLLWLYPDESSAFGALVVVMQERGLRHLYMDNLKMLQARLWQVGQLLPRRLTEHMEANTVTPVLYASSWLLTAYASDFPLFFSSRIMDVILTDSYIEPMMKVVLGILNRNEKVLMECNDMERLTNFLKAKVPKWPRLYLQDLLTEALAMEWTPAQDRVLKQIQDTESVVDAVQRVHCLVGEENTAERPEASISSTEGSAGPGLSRPRGVMRSTSLSWASRLNSSSISLQARPGSPCNAPQASAQGCVPFGALKASPPSTPSQSISLPRDTGDTSATRFTNLLELEDTPTVAPDQREDTTSSTAAVPRQSSGCDLPRAASLVERSSVGSFGDFITPEMLDRQPPANAPESASGSDVQQWPPSVMDSLPAHGSSEPDRGTGGPACSPGRVAHDWNSDFWISEALPADRVEVSGKLDAVECGSASLSASKGPQVKDERAQTARNLSTGVQSARSSTSFGDFQPPQDPCTPQPRGLLPMTENILELPPCVNGGSVSSSRSLMDEDISGGSLNGPAITQLGLENLGFEIASASSCRQGTAEEARHIDRATSKIEAELSNFSLAQGSSMQSHLS